MKHVGQLFDVIFVVVAAMKLLVELRSRCLAWYKTLLSVDFSTVRLVRDELGLLLFFSVFTFNRLHLSL